MEQNKKTDFIVIDDSKLDCFIAERVIRNTGHCNDVRSFADANDAIHFIKNAPRGLDPKTIILVDIQMPVMNGFEFIEAFQQLDVTITSGYVIFVISSSINENDLKKVHSYASVSHFINKPLNINILNNLLAKL